MCSSLQFFHPALSFSLSAVLLHVVLGLHRFRCPSGDQVNGVLQSLFGSFRFEDVDFVFIALLIFHVSQPYIKTGFTSVLYSLTLVCRLMLLRLQYFFNLKNTLLALSTPLWMSCMPPPSLETVAPRYTNRSTSSLTCPFTSTASLLCEFIRSSLHLSTFKGHFTCHVDF